MTHLTPVAFTLVALVGSPALGDMKTQPKPRKVRGLAECGSADRACGEAAREFAPMIWLAPDELAYPMLPHPFAFDRVDNDGDGLLDLDDPDEVTALLPEEGCDKKQVRAELGRLLKRLKKYNERLALGLPPNEDADLPTAGDQVLVRCGDKTRQPLDGFRLCREVDGKAACGPPAAVLYHVQRKDEQQVRGRRSGLPKTPRRPVDALQYWMYYPWDDEHLHDGEHVTVFVPRADGPAGAPGAGSPVEAVIGAGHVASTGNNILVSTPWDPVPQRPGGPDLVGPHTPWRIPPHLPVLVEMGKHASAPDLNCNGRFDVGLDANVLPTGAWGTRDVNFALDKTQWGDVKDWFSLQRARNGLMIERSFYQGGDAARQPYVNACPEASLGRELLLGDDPASGPARTGYRLVDAGLLRDISRAAKAKDDATLRRLLFDNQELLFGEQVWATLQTVKYRGEALARWAENETLGSQPRPDVWNHTDFGTYVNDFKLATFPRISVGPIFSDANGNGRWGAFFRFSDIRVFGRRLAPDSSIELRALVDRVNLLNPANPTSVARFNETLLGRDSKPVAELGFVYNAFSTAYRGPYVGLSYRDTHLSYRREYLYPEGRAADPEARDYVVEERLSRNLYIEAGYSVALPGLLEQLFRWGKLKRFAETHPLQFRFGLAGPLLKGERRQDTDDPDILKAYNVPRAVEFRVSIQLVAKSLLGRQHPLERQN